MALFNDKLEEGLFNGGYICPDCGDKMTYEDEWEDILICPACGNSMKLEEYGAEDEEYENLYPTYEELTGEYDEEEEDGEYYEEVYNELDDND